MGEVRPELTKFIPQPEILRIIECPVCKEVPFPPIYMCNTGHDICKSCKPKLKECPLCKSGFSDTRKFSVEKMVLASTHSCSFKDDGCQLEAAGELLCDHIRICQCRSFLCPGTRSDTECPATLSIKSSQAREHFSEKHKAKFCRTRPSLPYRSKCILTFEAVEPDHSALVDGRGPAWHPIVLECQGQDFLCQSYTRSSVIYWTIFCIGTEEEARKYSAKIMFSSNKEQRVRLQWKVPVQPIIKCEELRRGNAIKGVIIPSCSFNDFKMVAIRDDDKSEYTFYTDYKILKRE